MVNIQIKQAVEYQAQLRQMRMDAQFEAADDGRVSAEALPDLSAALAIHGAAAPPKVPKVFLTNDCSFNCAYCGCRSTRDGPRYCHDPKKLAQLAVHEARRSHRGIFLTSAIYKNADYTQELIIRTLEHIRRDCGYTGYLHAKVMPGADPLLIAQSGRLANRLSVNIEVAKKEGYVRVAKQKNVRNILTPMSQIHDLIAANRSVSGFATTQVTQLMAGSVDENDRTILTLAHALYRKYELSRVYYTPFTYRNAAQGYDQLPFISTPPWRMARLYQADRLLELYRFTPEEIAPPDAPNLLPDLDPKAAWALRNLHLFPVEVNRADEETLLRVPGIGLAYAKRILAARRTCTLTHDILRQLKVSLKRSAYFITCNGRYECSGTLEYSDLRERLSERPIQQLSLLTLW